MVRGVCFYALRGVKLSLREIWSGDFCSQLGGFGME
jgi:hypothetical protein